MANFLLRSSFASPSLLLRFSSAHSQLLPHYTDIRLRIGFTASYSIDCVKYAKKAILQFRFCEQMLKTS
jgi:hypothetical protein